jgi:hypothetical protein
MPPRAIRSVEGQKALPGGHWPPAANKPGAGLVVFRYSRSPGITSK